MTYMTFADRRHDTGLDYRGILVIGNDTGRGHGIAGIEELLGSEVDGLVTVHGSDLSDHVCNGATSESLIEVGHGLCLLQEGLAFRVLVPHGPGVDDSTDKCQLLVQMI